MDKIYSGTSETLSNHFHVTVTTKNFILESSKVKTIKQIVTSIRVCFFYSAILPTIALIA